MAQRSLRPGESRPRSEYWRDQSEDWESSGLTQADFCAERGLSLPALRWWRWKLKREDSGSTSSWAPEKSSGMRLVPVRVVDAEVLTYACDTAGDLIDFNDRAGNSIRFEYDKGYLTDGWFAFYNYLMQQSRFRDFRQEAAGAGIRPRDSGRLSPRPCPLTDDPSRSGTADATMTPITLPPHVVGTQAGGPLPRRRWRRPGRRRGHAHVLVHHRWRCSQQRGAS